MNAVAKARVRLLAWQSLYYTVTGLDHLTWAGYRLTLWVWEHITRLRARLHGRVGNARIALGDANEAAANKEEA